MAAMSNDVTISAIAINLAAIQYSQKRGIIYRFILKS